MIKSYLYDGAGHDKEVVLKNALPKITSQQLLWIDLTGRDAQELARLDALLKISAHCVSDIQTGDPEFSLNTYEGYLHFDVAALHLDSHASVSLPAVTMGVRLDFLVGKSWLVTVHDGELEFLQEFRDQNRGETLIGKLTPAALASSLLDWHLSPFLAASEKLENFCDKLDERILAEGGKMRNILPEIVSGRRYISDLRRLLVPQRSVFYGLSRADVALITGNAAAGPFKNLEHRFERALDIVEHGRDLVQGSFELYSTRIAETTNVLIRRLTFISILLGAIGAVAGIFGMNFDTPYSHSGQLGFWAVIASLGASGLSLGIVSRIKGWI